MLPTVRMDGGRWYEGGGIIDILNVGIKDAIKCCFVLTICFLFGCFPGMCESLGVRHWSDHLSLNETVEFISSGGEPGAPGSGGDKGGRHRGIDEGVIGEGLVVVRCQDKGKVRGEFNDPVFSRSNPEGNFFGSEEVDGARVWKPR